jgi:hypothetical protein
MYEVWEASGVFRERLTVWRAELRFFREGLHAFDVDTLEDLLSCLGDLASYAIGGEAGAWLRICDASSREQNTSRRPPARWWAAVREAFVDGLLSLGRKRKGYNPMPSFQRCVELAGAHMARAASLARISGLYDVLRPGEFGRQVGEKYQEILERKRTSWAERVNIKTGELRAQAWVVGEAHHYA